MHDGAGDWMRNRSTEGAMESHLMISRGPKQLQKLATLQEGEQPLAICFIPLPEASFYFKKLGGAR